MRFDEYRKKKALNASGIKQILRSPLHYWYEYISTDKPEFKDTPALRIGTALHALFLEKKILFVGEPDINRRTKAGREEYQEWLHTLKEGTIVLSADDRQKVRDMNAALLGNPHIYALLDHSTGEAELTKMWKHACEYKHKPIQVPCKARIDFHGYLPEGTPFLLDLKTCRDASPAGFARTIAEYKYHVQAAFYLSSFTDKDTDFDMILDFMPFFFACVETSPPYATALYTLDPRTIEQGKREFERAIQTWLICKENFGQRQKDPWPTYDILPHTAVLERDSSVWDVVDKGLHLPRYAQDSYYDRDE